MDGASGHLHYPWETAPGEAEAITVAKGVLWIRLPLPMALDHVNIYAIDEGESWTVVDTGVKTRRSVEMWQKILAGPLQGKPVSRVLLTHYHPDHVGMAGWLMERGAELVTSRTSYLTARMLILDVEEKPTQQAVDFWVSAGMDEAHLEKRKSERPFNFADLCAPLPVGFTRLQQGDVFHAGGRAWDVHMGYGHASEHVTLWSRDDHLVIAGDQIISSISPNIGVYPGEPAADPLSEWLESCDRLALLARDEHLVLSGHKLPFYGLPHRMQQLSENHIHALDRLVEHLDRPRVASECFAPLFKRRVDEGIYGLALVETVAHLNHLLVTGRVTRERDPDDAWLWSAV
ncbi:MBL fold metallo-hydrolase [Alisedimentitalea sp. MJ-SS2]|uniref:MBL fold metallo-hydrolase n=1 Tax=Aliisedimentitalea sp. MJ-SS2 TaxID=3049795 RepID=UPI00290E8F6F|nr:MBL fold metallo-hydrolase [Alisedimentitalea sp. MJ-SS2]MDU8928251.1 MBL fold metallo-hydrolase [Alisedimentitalea sp. MJ-SS2]